MKKVLTNGSLAICTQCDTKGQVSLDDNYTLSCTFCGCTLFKTKEDYVFQPAWKPNARNPIRKWFVDHKRRATDREGE